MNYHYEYQAKLDFKTGAITGVEALLRWDNPNLGSVTPMQFIPVAEETGLIVPIAGGDETACAQNSPGNARACPPVCMAVNLSLRQLTDDNLLKDIKAAWMIPVCGISFGIGNHGKYGNAESCAPD